MHHVWHSAFDVAAAFPWMFNRQRSVAKRTAGKCRPRRPPYLHILLQLLDLLLSSQLASLALIVAASYIVCPLADVHWPPPPLAAEMLFLEAWRSLDRPARHASHPVVSAENRPAQREITLPPRTSNRPGSGWSSSEAG